MLLSHGLQIVQEVQMDVELCLLALPGVHKDDLQTVFSHPQVMLKSKHSYACWQLADFVFVACEEMDLFDLKGTIICI